MGRYDLRAQRVLASANLALETKRISTPPVWHQVVQDIPPPPRLTRPVKSHSSRHQKFKPVRITYPEDALRQEFFSDHPWELARPKVVLEDSGNDHKGYDWGELEQEGKRVDGERYGYALSREIMKGMDVTNKHRNSVIQRQRHLMQHGLPTQDGHPSPKLSKHHAYDIARSEFYAHRHLQDMERRIAVEEAKHTGAYFMPGPNAIAEPLEDAQFEKWKMWAASRVAGIKNQRMAGYSGSEVEEGEEERADALAVAEEMDEAGKEEEGDVVERAQTSQDAVASAVEGMQR
jgi:small subunit ribosomal protein S23